MFKERLRIILYFDNIQYSITHKKSDENYFTCGSINTSTCISISSGICSLHINKERPAVDVYSVLGSKVLSIEA